jgi:hypothetical protein
MSENNIAFDGLHDDQIRMFKLFHPLAFEKNTQASRDQIRFVHYTSADTAMKIIQNAEVWMRRSSVMNDFSELEYGLGCLNAAFREQHDRFKSLFDGMFSNFSDKITERFNSWVPHFRADTYIACLSEHDASEDSFGRLSMWRAYGQTTGIALVLNGGPILRPSDALKAYSSPVAYLSPTQFQIQFRRLLDGLENDLDYLRAKGEDVILNAMFAVFRSAMLCTKHPGFHEEREWRVIYSPTYMRSDRIAPDIATIGGVPQPICKIPLRDVPEENLVGIEVPTFIERVIIGPSDHPHVVGAALATRLRQAGMTDPASRIFVSDIPLRR